jgi:hypothetical protein
MRRGQPIGSAILGDYRLDPPEPPEAPPWAEDGCPECGSADVVEDKHERVVECVDCGHVLAAFDWDAVAEARAERDT